ncbi:ABC transporter ATP-binding protein [Acetanaerobacterium elongatum]|uniref:ABC-2 type transport system ATP-binding protein n=1 Tax=Acetanaerobacterium elongatum TaxID=258515 RepID=A0A1H0CX29_9FIRM|nr:ABC transporter ATP-binding protein [Acetanaerobacterium elongatum]SDN62356.1 ABC-2 type transport system ATP-binding protein [Acetanaerobacterium elongatum]
MDAISVKKLTKTYARGKTALNELSLTVKEGEIFTLLGPNGAGKSTLINTLTTFLAPTSGEVTILGKNLAREQTYVRSQMACVAQRVSIDDHLSLQENMLFQGRLFHMAKADILKRTDTLTEAFGLKEYMKDRVATYSGGIKRRLDIAMSMISFPKILFLDEPTVGLDIESRQILWDAVKRIKNDFGTTVFLTTHYLEEADILSDTICIMKEGHELVQDTPQSLRQYTSQNLIRMSFNKPDMAPKAAKLLQQHPLVRGLRCEEQEVYVQVQNCDRDFMALNRWLSEQNITFSGIETVSPSLEDVFIAITGGTRLESSAS